MNGWLIIDKQISNTSTSVVNNLKRILRAKKAGHAGTLDPEATGILAVAFGEATKTIPYLVKAQKSYKFSIVFGASTNTDDATGSVIKTSEKRPSNEDLKSCLNQFVGKVYQVPPAVSAIKINGERAYSRFRKGEENLVLKPRELWVNELSFIRRIDKSSAQLSVTCGKGGYVRSIARDIGELLGCYAHAKEIRRTSSGPFTLADTVDNTLITTKNSLELEKRILPTHACLKHINHVNCSLVEANKLKNGQPIVNNYMLSDGTEALLLLDGRPISLCLVENKKIFPKRVFLLDLDY